MRHRQRLAAQRTGWHEGALHASHRLPVPPLSPPSAFDSLVKHTSRWTGAITTIEDGIAAGCTAGCSAILDDSELLSMPSLLMLVAVRRRGAARRRPRWPRRCSSAAAMFARLGRAARASPASPATPFFPMMPSSTASCGAQKMETDRPSFFALCARLCVCHACF